ncbi:oligopeptidase B [Microcella alkaliphila]|uniref:Oligopeptidase B n=1 Tax=Microcella alkaliphila TaxID=279828 RepID=A0A0U5BHN3_9MICO|nr:oligopeptidase B [Microcella alkaliphila]
MSIPPPQAPRIPVTRTHHGDTVTDHYEWMRDKTSEDVLAHLRAENAYAEARMQHLDPLRERIVAEIRSRTQETDMGIPVREGDWWYYGRTVEGKQYSIQCRVAARPIDPADPTDPVAWTPPPPLKDPAEPREGEQVILDANVEAEGHDFFSLGTFDISDDGRFLLFGVDTEGDERYTLRIRDLETGEQLADEIRGTSSGAFFDPSGRYVFYSTVDASWRPDTVWRHEVGTDPAADVRVFHEPDDSYWVGAGRTRSGRYLVIGASSSVTSETRVLDASDPTGEFALIWAREQGVEYDAEHAVLAGRDWWLITHNKNAPDFTVVAVPVENPHAEPVTVIEHEAGRRVEGVDAFARFLVFDYRTGGLPKTAVARLDGGQALAELTWDELVPPTASGRGGLLSIGARGNPEWQQPTLRIGYTSFIEPATVASYDVAAGFYTVLKRQPVLGGYASGDYAEKRDWAIADDGTRIPISLVWKRGLVPALDGGEASNGPLAGGARPEPSPLELYGYGSYEASMDPGFSIPRLSLLDRGVVFAIAHVRGGGELGRDWYEKGKFGHKKNTFTDFIACARHLIDTGVTAPERLVAEGGSAGGLLMGAVANMAPELFAGILADVPFVDPLTSILDPSLPLTVIEWDEWGNPLHDAEAYQYIKSYAPYENVREQAYPRILAVTSLNDTRVLYVEPAKWVARLREVGADAMLRCEMEAGHGGVSGRYSAWNQRAIELAWLLDVLGLADAPADADATVAGSSGAGDAAADTPGAADATP